MDDWVIITPSVLKYFILEYENHPENREKSLTLDLLENPGYAAGLVTLQDETFFIIKTQEIVQEDVPKETKSVKT